MKSWPETCPYEEIYKAIGKWYGLFKTDWINPANLRNCGVTETLGLLDKAKKFHEQIAGLYHENSYAHYGADADRKAWRKVVWKVDSAKELREIESLIIVEDDRKGELRLRSEVMTAGVSTSMEFDVRMQAAADPGDQTVPLHSSDAQLRSGKFKGVFRQRGYEHQASYDDENVIDATLYCLFRIISTMEWSKT